MITINGTTIAITGNSSALSIYNVVVDVVRPVSVTTSAGQEESTTALATNWMCAIIWKIGREKVLFDKTSHLLDAVMTCRVIPGVTVLRSDRVIHNDVSYDIVDVIDINNLGRRLKIVLRRVE